MTRIGPTPSIQTIPTTRYGLAKLSARWGRIEVADPAWGGARGWRESTLTVYPPGTSPTERMLLTARARWTFWSITAGILLAALVAGSATAAVALAVAIGSAALCVVGQVVASARTRRVRARIRSLTVRTVGGTTPHPADHRRFDECVAELLALDDSVRSGDIGLVEHELGWAAVYNRLG